MADFLLGDSAPILTPSYSDGPGLTDFTLPISVPERHENTTHAIERQETGATATPIQFSERLTRSEGASPAIPVEVRNALKLIANAKKTVFLEHPECIGKLESVLRDSPTVKSVLACITELRAHYARIDAAKLSGDLHIRPASQPPLHSVSQPSLQLPVPVSISTSVPRSKSTSLASLNSSGRGEKRLASLPVTSIDRLLLLERMQYSADRWQFTASGDMYYRTFEGMALVTRGQAQMSPTPLHVDARAAAMMKLAVVERLRVLLDGLSRNATRRTQGHAYIHSADHYEQERGDSDMPDLAPDSALEAYARRQEAVRHKEMCPDVTVTLRDVETAIEFEEFPVNRFVEWQAKRHI